MSITAAFMVPHPPMIVPQVGQGSEAQVAATIKAYNQVADEIAALQPETIVISSPHATMYMDYFHISPGRWAEGSFRNFRAPEVAFREEYDTELVRTIEELAAEKGFPAGTMGEREPALDHGTMVPLYFIRKKYSGFRLVRIGLSGLPLTKHYELGQIIQAASEKTGRRVVYVASGDLSHKLQDYGPYGFAPEGPAYDARIMDVCSRAAFGELFDFDENFCEKAAECGHRSFVIMAGALDGIEVRATQLVHEDVTGVGYGICTFYPMADSAGHPDERSADRLFERSADRQFLRKYLEQVQDQLLQKKAQEDPYVALARRSLETYLTEGHRLKLPAASTGDAAKAGDTANSGIPEEMLQTRAGAFVSIHEHGQLRGCIGTILPVTGCVAEEIIRNAVSAATEDPRFMPIEADELPWLEISVDVLGEPEHIDSPDQLDVKRYGVIVTKDGRRGLLLPDLEGVDTVARQISIAKQKAGIGPGEDVELQRFEVIRHH